MIAPCRPSCPAGSCANCIGFDRMPPAERPHCVTRQSDLHAAMDETAAFAARVAPAQQKRTEPEGQQQ